MGILLKDPFKRSVASMCLRTRRKAFDEQVEDTSVCVAMAAATRRPRSHTPPNGGSPLRKHIANAVYFSGDYPPLADYRDLRYMHKYLTSELNTRLRPDLAFTLNLWSACAQRSLSAVAACLFVLKSFALRR